MTSVQFYHNASDPFVLIHELLGKAYRGGHKAIVVSPDASSAERLDRQLWTADPGDFIPHVMVGSPLASETPVLIATAPDLPRVDADLLFNLAAEVPTGCERFRIVIEIVGCSEAERLPARTRWMQYKQQQFSLKAFDAERRISL